MERDPMELNYFQWVEVRIDELNAVANRASRHADAMAEALMRDERIDERIEEALQKIDSLEGKVNALYKMIGEK